MSNLLPCFLGADVWIADITKEVARTKLIPATVLWNVQSSEFRLVKQAEMPLDAARKLT